MPELVAPTMGMHASFVAAMEELRAEGHGSPDDQSTAGRELRTYGSRWHEPEEFRRYLQLLREEETEEYAQQAGRVPQTTLWWIAERRQTPLAHAPRASLTGRGGWAPVVIGTQRPPGLAGQASAVAAPLSS